MTTLMQCEAVDDHKNKIMARLFGYGLEQVKRLDTAGWRALFLIPVR